MSMLDAKKIGEMALYYSSCAERDRQYAAGERQGSRLLEIFRAAIIDTIAQCESEELRERGCAKLGARRDGLTVSKKAGAHAQS
jgi:hypothetical protein